MLNMSVSITGKSRSRPPFKITGLPRIRKIRSRTDIRYNRYPDRHGKSRRYRPDIKPGAEYVRITNIVYHCFETDLLKIHTEV